MASRRVSLESLAALRAAVRTAAAVSGAFARRWLPRSAAAKSDQVLANGPRPASLASPALFDPSFDAETREWAGRVLAGEVRHPFPPGDPEGEHDACRLRGVLGCLCQTVPNLAHDRLRTGIRALLRYAADKCDRKPGVGWDTTTAAVRLVNLLAATDQLAIRGVSLSGWCGDWVGPFLEAHRLSLQVGRLSEPSGNHRLLNTAGHVAFSMLMSPRQPTPPRLVLEMVDQVGRQFLPDGGHCERVPHYHLQVVAVLEALQRADERRGGTLRDQLRPLLRHPLRALHSMLGPGGEPYRVGDVGRTFSGKLTSREVVALIGGLTTAPDDGMTRLPYFGVAGATWLAEGEHRLLAECGATGTARRRGHGHADTHAFCYYLDGCEVVADPGTFLYADAAEAIWFRTPEAHAVVHWPVHPSAVPRRFFRWSRRPPTGHLGCGTPSREPGVMFASSATWRVDARSFTHRRTWVRLGTGLQIVDSLVTPRRACAEVRFPLGPDVAVVDVSGPRAVVRACNRSVEFRVMGFDVGGGTAVPAWYAPRYGAREDTVALVWPIAVGGQHEVHTRIAPVA